MDSRNLSLKMEEIILVSLSVGVVFTATNNLRWKEPLQLCTPLPRLFAYLVFVCYCVYIKTNAMRFDLYDLNRSRIALSFHSMQPGCF